MSSRHSERQKQMNAYEQMFFSNNPAKLESREDLRKPKPATISYDKSKQIVDFAAYQPDNAF